MGKTMERGRGGLFCEKIVETAASHGKRRWVLVGDL